MKTIIDGPSSLYLAWTAPSGVPCSYWLRPGVTRIGSASANDLVLDVPGVSRHHAELWLEQGLLRLRDLGSKNGSWVNGKPAQGAGLFAGDAIEIGSATLSVEEAEGSDGRLAIHTGGPRDVAEITALTTPQETDVIPRPDTATDLLVLQALADHLGPSPSDALVAVAKVLRVQTIAVVSWTGKEATVRAHAGELTDGLLEELQSLAAIPIDAAMMGKEVMASGAGFKMCWEYHRDSGRANALVVSPGSRVADRDELLQLILTFFLRYWDREHVPRRPPAEDLDLVFPEGYVAGISSASRRLHVALRAALQGDLPLLLIGPTGAGKDVLARILHGSSQQHEGPFVAVNCAAIPSDLLEAELFGIEAGIATGVRPRTGRFQESNGGVLFLDEIGDMPLNLQAKLLRTLEAKEVTPVGGRPVAVDARIVAATNSDLDQAIQDGRFRADLYYRLAGFVVEVPPLAHRRDDIPALVESMVLRLSHRLGKDIPGVSVRALRRLAAYAWPGNIRQLQHEISRLVYTCSAGEPIHSGLLSERYSADSLDDDRTLPAQVAALEKRLLRDVLQQTEGNQSQAARLLGISRNGLRHRMSRLGLSGDEGS